MSPEEMLEKLKSVSSNRTNKTLDAIYDVCKIQLESGATNFSYSHIARIGKGRGVPSKQSLHNKSGEAYRALIDTFEAITSEKKRKTKSTNWVENIEDPTLRLLVKQMEAELNEAKKIINEIKTPETEIYVYDDLGSSMSRNESLTPIERKALEYLTSTTFRKKWQFTENEFGEYVDNEGGVVFRSGTLDAIRKALRLL